MARRMRRQRVVIDPGDIEQLNDEEIRAILRAADELINVGGRNMLCKILKGSKEKMILEHSLQENPYYGYYAELPAEQVMQRIDWLIDNWYLQISYNGRLPVLLFTKKGWAIERETYSDWLLKQMEGQLDSGDFSIVDTMQRRPRDMIMILIEKIRETGNARFIPLLKAWQAVDYKRVQIALQEVIDHLSGQKIVQI